MTTSGVIRGEQRYLGTESGSDQKFRETFAEVVTVVGHTSQQMNWANPGGVEEPETLTNHQEFAGARDLGRGKRGEEVGDLARGLIWRTWCLHPAGWAFKMRLEVYHSVVKLWKTATSIKKEELHIGMHCT
ncbi:hypothetical protein HJG60_011896 [Phyllostomus discolor]|uniref:Uncharacterized protein n=1 Tax=Phyllostomus discolor TaxID=89673 RepID=A0A834DWG2_9CHIR|nr:hypothetical protein HJG60_011896 [Phyllostomus discolor]